MLKAIGAATLWGISLVTAAAISGVGCGGDTSSSTTSNSGYGSSNLVNTCDQVCTNVVAQCATAGPLYKDCTNACGALALVKLGCLDPFTSYVACLAGAKSVTCQGDSIIISPPECEADRQQALSCNAGPGLISACIAVPSSGACGHGTSSESAGGQEEFCVGPPANCTAAQPNPLGIGTYCCP